MCQCVPTLSLNGRITTTARNNVYYGSGGDVLRPEFQRKGLSIVCSVCVCNGQGKELRALEPVSAVALLLLTAAPSMMMIFESRQIEKMRSGVKEHWQGCRDLRDT